MPTPTRTGYTFLGWYFGTPSKKITEDTKVATASEHTLVASWQQIPLSEWVEQSAVPVNATIVNTKTLYKYRSKSYTTAPSSTLSGWTLYNTTKVAGDWQKWSAWSTNQWFEIGEGVADYQKESKTQYRYCRFTCSKNSTHGWWGYGISCRVPGCKGSISQSNVQYIWLDTNYDYAWTNWKDGSDDGKVKQTTIDGISWYYWPEKNDQYRAETMRTVYRVRHKYYIFTYHFYKWSDWSAWQDSPISATGDTEVESKKMYQYRLN